METHGVCTVALTQLYACLMPLISFFLACFALFSQTPNCPSALPAVVRVLAECKGLPFEEVARATGENSRAFFGMEII